MTTRLLPITKRDHRLLMHLWRWKLVSASALAHRYFDGNTVYAYKRCNILKQKGLIQIIPIRIEKHFAWTLTKKGLVQIREYLPDLKVVSTSSGALWHDALASAIHLGDWYMGCPEGSDYFSERQLQCYIPEAYPEWVPQTNERRPDGYWLANSESGQKVVAFELQRSTKSQKWWDGIDEFYASTDEINRVIWVIDNKTGLKRRAIALGNDFFENKKHAVFLLQDVLKHGWKALSINDSEKLESIESILGSMGVPGGNSGYLGQLLNFRKKPVITDTLPKSGDP